MLNPNEYHIQTTHRHDMERAAQKDAQLTEIRTAHKQPAPHALALAKMGEVLVAAGSKLQERYGTLIEEASHKPAEVC